MIHLQSKKIVTAKEIAKRFEVSLRTVYRDINTLQDAGVPIGSENGVGYFIVDGYSLPPISLTEEEANSLIVSEQFINSQGDVSLTKHFASLLFKIKSTLKHFQKDNIELLSSRIQTFATQANNPSNALPVVQKHISNQIILAITYNSIYKEEETRRQIEPLALYFANNAWVLIAFCHLRKGIREFRLDRITSLHTTSQRFTADIKFSLKKYFEAFETS